MREVVAQQKQLTKLFSSQPELAQSRIGSRRRHRAAQSAADRRAARRTVLSRRGTAGQLSEGGLATHDDLIDAIRGAIAQGIADPKRIASMGASGGYATLQANMVGPSNVKMLIESFPPYWGPVARAFPAPRRRRDS